MFENKLWDYIISLYDFEVTSGDPHVCVTLILITTHFILGSILSFTIHLFIIFFSIFFCE
jgi:hypothetical protein